jgi:hypothetical protein
MRLSDALRPTIHPHYLPEDPFKKRIALDGVGSSLALDPTYASS